MKLGNGMQPGSEISDFMAQELFQQFFENLHSSILAVVFIFQVFHANTKYKMGVTTVQCTGNRYVFPGFVKPDQFIVSILLVLRLVRHASKLAK